MAPGGGGHPVPGQATPWLRPGRRRRGKRRQEPHSDVHSGPRLPEWHRNAVIYEVNLRHYTAEGSFRAFKQHLPRLREMGVDILWLMPIHPVSVKGRKGLLGSPYAVADYYAVNPEFGTLEEFKQLVRAIHRAGMHVIMDWVPNHTGWDHPWIEEHPDWYTRDAEGRITDPVNRETGETWGWTDVADLDFGNPAMRQAMIGAMVFWVEETGIDGFRVDVAHGIPQDFWASCCRTLYKIKPLFMLAEAEDPSLVNPGYFAADYAWQMHEVFKGIARTQQVSEHPGEELFKGNLVSVTGRAQKEVTALDIDRQLAEQHRAYHRGYKMYFTSNHDENAWSGSEFGNFGEGHQAFAVLAATFEGMPLLYSGQESAVDRQFAFFSKDEIPWGSYPYAGFYKTLFHLKHLNKALWNAPDGGPPERIVTGRDDKVYAFMREKDGFKVVVAINLSAARQQITLRGDRYTGRYTEIFDGREEDLSPDFGIELAPWGFRVWSCEPIALPEPSD